MVTKTQRSPHSDIQVPPWSLRDNGSVTGMSPNGDNDTERSPNGDNDILVPLWPIGGRDDTGMSPNGDNDTEMSPKGDNDIQVPLWPIGDNDEAGMSPPR